MFKIHKEEIEINGKKISLETGKGTEGEIGRASCRERV